MRNKFEEIMQSLIECFSLNSSSKPHSEQVEPMECDCMTTCPSKPQDTTEEQSEQEQENMLLRDLGRGGE